MQHSTAAAASARRACTVLGIATVWHAWHACLLLLQLCSLHHTTTNCLVLTAPAPRQAPV